MTFFLCKLWPYLAGGLIGWLLAGWLARRLRHAEPPIEKIVEKQVDKIIDNPKHLSLIGKLENENSKIPDLVSRIAGFESTKPKTSEKIIEKMVDNPEHLALIKKLKAENQEITSLRNRINSFENQQSKVTDADANNSKYLARIKELEDENGKISDLQNKIKSLEGAEAKTIEVEKLVDNPEHLKTISDLEEQLNDLKRGQKIDLQAAKAAGIKIKSETDLSAIEGIGPKINDLIHADGINTFVSLADTSPETIQKTLDKAGPSFAMANPGTWPDQANLAANNRWGALKALQDVLDGGVYPDGSTKKSSAENNSAKKSLAEDDSSASGTSSGKAKAKKVAPLDIEAAKASGFKVKQKDGQDDFTLIEGIGPKINDLIHADGIHTFSELAKTYVEVIQEILDKAGPNYKLAKPGTWPAQAEMAAGNRWETLKAWQDELDGGE